MSTTKHWVAAVRDRTKAETAFGFGIRVDNIREARSVELQYRISYLLGITKNSKWSFRFFQFLSVRYIYVCVCMYLMFILWWPSYQRADPNFVMLTPNKEHLAEGIHWKIGKRPLLQSDVNSGNFDGVPKELRPLNKIL